MAKTILILLTIFSFCISLSAAPKTIKIGAFLSVTGPNSPLGTPERDTLQMLADQINAKGGVLGKQLEVIIEDDKSEPSAAINAANKLINQDKVIAIIGSSGTGTTMSVVQNISEQLGIPHISCAAGIAITTPTADEQAKGKGKVRKNIFRTPQTDVIAVKKILTYLKSKKITDIAIIYDSNPFGTSGKDVIVAQAPAFGINIKAEESFNTKDIDMTPQLTKIKKSGAKAILCWGTNPGPAIITKNLRQLKIKIPLIQSHGIANMKYIELSGKDADGVIFPAGKLIVSESLKADDKQKALLTEYKAEFSKKFGKDPDTFGGHAYDALLLLVNAIEKIKSTDKAKIVAELENTKNFVGIGGIFNFSPTDHDGLTEDAFALVTIKNGKWQLLQQ